MSITYSTGWGKGNVYAIRRLLRGVYTARFQCSFGELVEVLVMTSMIQNSERKLRVLNHHEKNFSDLWFRHKDEGCRTRLEGVTNLGVLEDRETKVVHTGQV